jgi:capsule polysaccharide export protein KpsE/RkpR
MDQIKSFSVSDYINIFLKHKKSIIIASLVMGMITAFIVLFIMDPIFVSTATVKTTSKESGLSGLMNLGNLPGIGDFNELTGGSSNLKEMALYENILNSRRCIDEVLLKFKLNDEWEFKYHEDAVKNFREVILEIKKDKTAGTMEIGIYDKNPVRAKDIAEFMIDQLNKINIALNVLNAKNNKEFIEQRYNLVKIDLQKIEDSLKDFQDKNGVAPDILVQASTKASIELESQIKSEEVKLEILRKILSPDQAEIKQHENLINSLNKQLSNIENSSYEEDKLNLKGVPDVVMNFLRLKRDVEIQNKIMTTLIPLLEQAKIEEKRNTPTVLILDQPQIPQKKTKPKRMILTATVTFVTFFLVYIYFILLAKWKSYKKAIKNQYQNGE